jgi:hypothetical protein
MSTLPNLSDAIAEQRKAELAEFKMLAGLSDRALARHTRALQSAYDTVCADYAEQYEPDPLMPWQLRFARDAALARLES